MAGLFHRAIDAFSGRTRLTIAAALAMLVGTPALACTASATVASDLGSYSPAAIRTAVVPALRSRAGLTCNPGVLVLLGGNYVKATYRSRNGMKLSRADGTAGAIAYALSADPDGKFVAPQDGTIDYMQNNLLNLLGLLGGSSADLPFFVRPAGGSAPAIGTYTDRVTIRWDWYICQGLGVLGACVLGADSGTATTVVDVTLTVAAKALVVTTTSSTTWDPINGTTRPRAIPGSRQRIVVTVTNPDIAPAETGLTVLAPLAPKQALALGSEGVLLTQGSPASTLTLAYAEPGSASDDVDFSIDNGSSWLFMPDTTSQSRVTTLRLRPQGSMAAGSSFSVSFPATIR